MYIAEQDYLHINNTVVAEKFPAIKEALEILDLIVFLPITKDHEVDNIEYEDLSFRKTIDKYFKKIYRDEIFDIFPGYQQPRIIEVWGDRLARIKKLESYLQTL
jgi:hypothetical protein